MPIAQDLLEMLICPACKGKVELEADGNSLKCRECGRIYPITNDIPSMLIIEDCPSCGAKAMIEVEGDNLKCPECGHTYPIRDQAR